MATLAIDDTGGVFPRDHTEGLDYTLNWSLVNSGVTPRGKTFRNLASADLVAHSSFEADQNEALHIESFEVPYDVFTLGEGGKTRRHFRRALKQATSHLSSNSGVFVSDGAASGSKIRAICDTPEMALFYRHLLRNHQGAAEDFDSEVVVYHARSLKLDADDQLKLGIPSSSFLFSNPAEKTMVIIGEVPTSLVYSSLQQLIGGGEREVSFMGEYEDVDRANLRTKAGDLVEKLEAGQQSVYRHTRPKPSSPSE